MAVFNEPTKWQTSLVNSGDANVIPQSTPAGTGEASFDDGFPQITQVPIGAGGIAPDRKDFNGLFKILGDWIFFNQNGGVSTYSENFDYIAGRVVSYNGNIYKCIQANGVSSTVVTPDSDTAYWQRLDNYVRSVNGVNADENGNVQLDGLVRSVNGINADTSGNVEISTRAPFIDMTTSINITSQFPSSISILTPYTAPYDCYLLTHSFGEGGVAIFTDSTTTLDARGAFYTIDGKILCNEGDESSIISVGIFLKKGQTVKITYYNSAGLGMNEAITVFKLLGAD